MPLITKVLGRGLSLALRRDISTSCAVLSPYQHYFPPLHHVTDVDYKDETEVPDDFRFVYCDFLPEPYLQYRNHLAEKLERLDMIKRREHVDIPEFYPGSILAVTVSNRHAAGGLTRFLGICTRRRRHGLRSSFTLRNIIDNMGVEITYECYCPLIQKIEIIKLEKRLDDDLTYLRDALPKYSTFPQDMMPVQLPEDMEVPTNPLKVQMKPKPWCRKFETMNLKGLKSLHLNARQQFKADKRTTAYVDKKYDILFHYGNSVTEEEQKLIYKELLPHLQRFDKVRRKISKITFKADDKL